MLKVEWLDLQRHTSGRLAGGLLHNDVEHVDDGDELQTDQTYLGTSHIELIEVSESTRSVLNDGRRTCAREGRRR